MQTGNGQLVKVVCAITLRQVINSTVANMKWSTGQSGLRNNPQTSHQINCCKHDCMTATTNSTNHHSHERKSLKKQIHKLQVSGFTNKLFHVYKNSNTPTLCKFPKIHANFPVQNSAISFQSRIVPNHLVRSNWIQKHIYRSYPTGYRSRSYPTGYRSEIYNGGPNVRMIQKSIES